MPDKKICAFIPARKGSVRIRDKNIIKLRGQPLIFWAYAQAEQSGIFDDIFLSTDSAVYEEIAMGFGLKTIRRAFPTDALSPDIEWIKQAFHRMKGHYADYDYFAIIRPTSPFRKPETIRRAWRKLLDYGDEFDSLKAYVDCQVTPYKIFEIRKYDDRREIMVPLLSDIPDAYMFPSNVFKHRKFGAQVGFLDICRTSNIEKYGNHFGIRICPFHVPDPVEAIDINTHFDLDVANALLDCGKAELPI